MARLVGEGGNVAGSAAGNLASNVSRALISAGKKASRSASRSSAPVRNTPTRTSSSTRNSSRSTSTNRNSGVTRTSSVVSRPNVGSTSRGTITPTQPAPPPLSLDEWLARGNDTVFAQQQAAYRRALEDYAAQYKAEQDKYGQEYEASLQKLQTDQDLGYKGLQDDYASRGLIQSGVYAQALNDFQNQYQARRDDLGRARTAYLNDLTTDKTNFEQEQALALARAKQEAANRRTASLGL